MERIRFGKATQIWFEGQGQIEGLGGTGYGIKGDKGLRGRGGFFLNKGAPRGSRDEVSRVER